MTAAGVSALPLAPRSAWQLSPLVQPYTALEPTLDLLNPHTPPVAPFPQSGTVTGLALYPTASGLEMQWALPARDLALALAAFSAPAPQPYLYLYHCPEDEAAVVSRQPLATAQLTAATVQQGWARYVMPQLAGEYRVELGIRDTNGGWLMLARSPCLTLAQPVGMALLHTRAANRTTMSRRLLTTGNATGPADDGLVLLQPVPADTSVPTPVAAPAYSMGGSGPLQPYPAQTVCIRGHLRIEGCAPPGTWLDLGGHPYQVGAGGHFMFTCAVHERGMIDAILHLFTRLPVETRPPETVAVEA